jgi:hypothetical protein
VSLFSRSSPELLAAQTRIQSLEAEVQRLTAQNASLQSALVAVTSPNAYRDQQAERPPIPQTEQEKEARRKQEEEVDILNRLRIAQEEPLFQTPEEFIQFVKGGAPAGLREQLEESITTAPAPPESPHNNTES